MLDEEWARLIAWLGKRGLVLRVPTDGKPHLIEKATGRYVRPF